MNQTIAIENEDVHAPAAGSRVKEILLNKKLIIIAIVVAVLVVAAFFFYRARVASGAPAFRFVTIEKGNMQSKVSATGTLGAVTTVSVGTQVSGQVASLLVDYNDVVKKGQLLATIDPTLARSAVIDAQANVDKAQAELLQMQRDYNRNRDLSKQGLIAKSAFEQSQSSMLVAQAEVRSAQVAMDRAKQNLAYTSIYAPIDGVVVERNVQQGQTVAASLSAPQLFLIANDLAHMQILAQVGEGDIAQIKAGQTVKFTVQALPNQTFNGTVEQVRLQSTTADNVVDYTVVINVDNAQNKLLPGMTARVDFLTQSATNVLKVSNAALRFQPTDEQLVQMGVQKPAPRVRTATGTNGTTGTNGATGTNAATSTVSAADRAARRAARAANGGSRPAIATLYYLDKDGKVATTMVRTGITDGTSTQIMGKDIQAGMKVIAGISTGADTAKTSTAPTTTSPFSGGGQQRGGGRPGGF
ncbi:MAG TPA: efflux RND transporter periplasmic adaptor subunit [Thermoanaerobaculia bacterium]|nr:efflux RND transporter periplasmic adaptor subunit [Thermoanaerobaculia bacterium]